MRDTIVLPFVSLSVDDPLTEVARAGARRLLAGADAEADAFLAMWRIEIADGRPVLCAMAMARIRIQTGIGPVEVRRAKVRTGATWR